MKPATILVATIVAVLAAGAAGFAFKRNRTETAGASAPAPKPIAPSSATPAVIELAPTDLGTAETREVRRELPLTGQLRPIHQAYLRAKVAGEVMEMRVKEGETVKAGQVLARIDPAEYQARLDERVASLAAAKATWENNERTRRNNEELLRKNFISQQSYDNALANTTVAEAQVRAAEANVVLAKKSLDDALVKAPWAGLVAERLAQVGDRAAIDARLINLVDLSRMELEASVPAADIPSVEVGQDVAFRVEGFGTRAFGGRIARIAPQSASGSRSIMVYVDIPNTDGALKGGMFAKGALTLTRRESVTAVPVAALREERGETVVYTIDGDRLARVPVRVGTRNEDEAWAEVSGVAPGARVIRSNLGALAVGAAVRVAAQSVQAAPTRPAASSAAPPSAVAPSTAAAPPPAKAP
jgi:RND family efflux transporter MFP subunit